MELKHNKEKNATFLPSISNMYVAALANENITRDIPCLSKTMTVKEYMNHLRPGGIFYYPFALYSAGHAKNVGAKKAEKYNYDTCMISQKSDETFILGDSSGYQFGTGANKYPWSDPVEQKRVQIDTMKWLEDHCNASMTLDLPPWALMRNKEARKAGFDNFQNCFDATVGALETFIENRTPGATQFLNILQGETTDAMDNWYNHVVEYNKPEVYGDRAFEGFAFAGRQSYCFFSILRRLVKLRDEGLLNNGPVLHFLGSGKLNNAPAFSRIQQILREQTNSNLMITFDAASPYLSAANGKVYADIILQPDNVTFDYQALPGAQTNKYNVYDYVEGGKMADEIVRLHMPHGRGFIKKDIYGNESLWDNSPIVKDIRYKDIYTLRDAKQKEIDNGNDNGTGKMVQIDSLAYVVAMAHNVYVHIEGIRRMNDIFNSGEMKTRLPGKYDTLDSIIKQVFNSKDPMSILEQREEWLVSFTGRGRRVKAPISTDDTFGLFFSKQEK